jgi:hypothetical protein
MSKTTNPVEREQIGALYCRMMEEIVVRDELIKSALAGHLPKTAAMVNVPSLHKTTTEEFCYLNLRLMQAGGWRSMNIVGRYVQESSVKPKRYRAIVWEKSLTRRDIKQSRGRQSGGLGYIA